MPILSFQCYFIFLVFYYLIMNLNINFSKLSECFSIVDISFFDDQV